MVTAETAGQQSEEVLAAGEAPLTGIGGMAAHVVIEALPGETLDDLLEYGRLMAHGIGSAAVDNVGERRLRSRINVVRRYKHKSCRTVVGHARP